MSLLEDIKRQGVGILLDEGPARCRAAQALRWVRLCV